MAAMSDSPLVLFVIMRIRLSYGQCITNPLLTTEHHGEGTPELKAMYGSSNSIWSHKLSIAQKRKSRAKPRDWACAIQWALFEPKCSLRL